MHTRYSSLPLALCASLALGALVGCQAANDDAAPDLSTRSSSLVLEGTDWSGRLHVEVVDCFSDQPRQHQTLGCSVDPSFVLVGGGARTFYGGAGALLTESRPFDDGQFRTWFASSKDHIQGDSHTLQVFAVGMRLDGVARATLAAQMQIKSSTSGASTGAPVWQTSTDEGFSLIGGGVLVNWTGEGSLLTRSSPFASAPENRTWIGIAKDHIKASSASLTVYAIGIRPTIPGFGDLDIATRISTSSEAAQHVGDLTVSTDGGWVTACPGAFSDWSPGQGRLLFGIIPGITTAEVLDKDHIKADAGVLTAYTRQIRVKP